MLQRLAQYIVRVQQQAREWVGKKARPYLLCVLNPQSAAYTVTGVTCGKEGEAEMKWGWWVFVRRSNFKMMFQRTMEAMEARCRLDSFSGSVMQIHKDELLSFVFELHKSIQELYTELIPESS